MELNINQSVSDAFYRYKMPQLSAKVEGKGNGIKTVIVNVTDIAKRLYRKPIYVTKYFGCELGAQIHVDEKNDRYIVNGAHDAARLQELLFGFINKFVLCSNCGNPETNLKVKVKAGVVSTTCMACGNRGQLDPTHRLTQFIIKNPPIDECGTTSKGKKSKKTKNGSDHQSNGGEHSPAGDENHNSPSHSDDEDDDDWGEDTTEEAQKQRLGELSEMARSLTINADAEKTEHERADIFFKHLTQMKQAGLISSRPVQVKTESERLNLGPRAILVVAEVLLSDPKTIVEDVRRYDKVFQAFTRCSDFSVKAQTFLLGAMASLVERFSDASKTCRILKEFYDADIIEEEQILSFFEKNTAKRYVTQPFAAQIAKNCEPMLKWLREADVESDSETEGSESSSEEDSPVKEAPKSASPKMASPPAGEDSDDDLDIDAI